MNRRIILAQLALAVGIMSATVIADNLTGPGSYDLSWNTIDGGGGTSSSGAYQLTSTIGQPDANDIALTGGAYTLFGGFWRGAIQSCQADITGNNIVDIDDLVKVITAWSSPGGPSDVNASGQVNIDDLVIIITSWGACP